MPAGSAKTCQRGQAIVEMCAGIIGIMAVVIGLVFICGLSIANVQTLFSAKINAEKSSRNPTVSGGAGQNIDSWNYGNDAIPFSADDKSVPLNTSADSGYYSNLLNDTNLSESNDESSAKYQKYIFSSDNYIKIPKVVNSNFTVDFPDLYVNAANLVVSEGSLNNNTAAQVEGLSALFNNLFGTRIQDIDLNKINRVYMPVIGN